MRRSIAIAFVFFIETSNSVVVLLLVLLGLGRLVAHDAASVSAFARRQRQASSCPAGSSIAP